MNDQLEGGRPEHRSESHPEGRGSLPLPWRGLPCTVPQHQRKRDDRGVVALELVLVAPS